MIKLTRINKYFNKGKENEIHVINDNSLTLPDKGLITFLGHSGSGKTTLLNVIGGLTKFDEGSIEFDDIKFNKYQMSKFDKYRKENIGYVFQNYNLLLGETVYDNLKLYLESLGINDKKEQEKRIEYVLKEVGMFKFRKKRVDALSGGQQQRVSIARALVKNSKLILADEPTGNLDYENSLIIMKILKKVSEKSLVILVTHNENLAFSFSDKIYQIVDGIINEKTDWNKNNNNINNIDKSNNEEHIYDNSFFDDSKKHHNYLYIFFKELKRTFLNLFKTKRKTRLLYLAFLLLGFALSISTLLYGNIYVTDGSNYISSDDYSTFRYKDNRNLDLSKETYKDLVLNDLIYDLKFNDEDINRINKHENSIQSYDFTFQTTTFLYDEKTNGELIKGIKPIKSNEVVISEGIAKKLLNDPKGIVSSYDEILDLELSDEFLNLFNIVGINHNSSIGTYLNEEGYQKYLLNKIDAEDVNDDLFNRKKYKFRDYSKEKQIDSYEITEGRDLSDLDYNTKNILLSIDTPKSVMDSLIKLEYNVIGRFKMKDFESTSEVIINGEYNENYNTRKLYPFNSIKYSLIEGELPSKNNEIIASIYSGHKMNDLVTKENYTFKVTGIYNAPIKYGEYLFKDDVSNIFLKGKEPNRYFKYNEINKKEIYEVVNKKNIELISTYENLKSKDIDLRLERFSFILVIASILIILLIVFMYLLMRSRIINDVYTIGVNRSIGVNRLELSLKNIAEISVITTFTSLVGYLIGSFLFSSMKIINYFSGIYVFGFNVIYFFGGIVLLYLISIIFGLLPLFILLRKTPSEINTKYDI